MNQLVIALFRTRQDTALAVSALWERHFDKRTCRCLPLTRDSYLSYAGIPA